MVAPLGLLSKSPLFGGIIFAVYILINVAPQILQTGDFISLIKAFGEIISGGQAEISQAIKDVMSGNSWAYLNMAGGILLTYSILKLFAWIADQFQSFEAPAVRWGLAIFAFSMISIAYNGVVSHQLVLPFSGITDLIIHLPQLTRPISPELNSSFQYCRGSPFC